MANDELSSGVKTNVVCVAEELGIKNYTIELSPGSQRGDNYLGVITKVVIKGEDEIGADTILDLIVKSAPQNEAFRFVTPVRAAFDREIYIYSEVFPKLTRLQIERGIANIFRPHPKLYRFTMSDKNEAIVMEDVKKLGFELHKRDVPLNLDHVLLVMKTYGKFHALSFALHKHKPELYREIFKHTREQFFNELKNFEESSKLMTKYCDRVLKALDPALDQIACQNLGNFKLRPLEIMKRILDPDLSGQYAVIGHGDSWVNNILFKYDENLRPHSPSQVCLLDWQMARAGSPALDLSYFIFTCTDRSLRDKHYDYLIQEYYDSLSSFLRELGCAPEELLPFDILQQHFKKFSIYGLYQSVFTLHMMMSDMDEIPDLLNANDVTQTFKGFEYETKNIDKYYQRVRDIITDFVKYGYEFGLEL